MQVVLWGTCFWVKRISKGLHQFILPASLMAQMVKNLPAMQETPVFFLGLEVPLEKGSATHSSIFAWRINMDR